MPPTTPQPGSDWTWKDDPTSPQGGGWLPPGYPSAGGTAPTGQVQTPNPPPGGQTRPTLGPMTTGGGQSPNPPPQAATNGPSTPDPFEALGGGVWLPSTQQWVPPDHPAAQAPDAQPQGGGQAGGGASTYYDAPGPGATAGGPNEPAPYSTNPGVQDTLLETLLGRATQGTTIDAMDPNIRAQSDAYRAQAGRAARDLLSDRAEAVGPLASGAMRGNERMIAENLGQAAGSFEAQLVGRELESRRAEISLALQGLMGQVDADQQRQLTRELAALDAELKRLGISSAESMAQAENALRERLGVGSLNLDAARILFQNQQFGDTLGFQVGAAEAAANRDAMLDWMNW